MGDGGNLVAFPGELTIVLSNYLPNILAGSIIILLPNPVGQVARMKTLGKALKIIGSIGIGLQILLILLGLFNLWSYDLAISQAAEQGQFFRYCYSYRRIYISSIFGAAIWGFLFLIIFASGLIFERIGKKRGGNNGFN